DYFVGRRIRVSWASCAASLGPAIRLDTSYRDPKTESQRSALHGQAVDWTRNDELVFCPTASKAQSDSTRMGALLSLLHWGQGCPHQVGLVCDGPALALAAKEVSESHSPIVVAT